MGLIPGLYWVGYTTTPAAAIATFRPSLFVISFLLALLSIDKATTWAETRFGGVMALMCAVLVAPSLSATVPTRALANCVKVATLCLIAFFMSRALRREANALAFGRSLILTSILSAGICISTYVRLVGLTISSYGSARVFKQLAMNSGVPLNPIAFTSVFSYVSGVCLLPRNRLLLILGPPLIWVSSALTGSRAPVAVLLASGLVLLISNGLLSRRPMWRGVAFVGITVAAVLFATGCQILTFRDMSEATEGRWDLWSVAWQKFLEHPFLGSGFESWRDDLASRLPGVYEFTSLFESSDFVGGYHNEYLTLLAEQGLIGFFPVMAFFLLLLWCSTKLAFANWVTWANRQWALLGCLFLMVRAAFETPGLFGYGQEPADYLAFCFVGIVCSRFSVEEDYLRSAQRIMPPECRLKPSSAARITAD